MSKKRSSKAKKPIKRKSPIKDPKTGKIVKGVAQHTNKNGTAGQPTKYKPEYCDMMTEFFSGEKYKRVLIEDEERETKTGKTRKTKYKYMANDLPFLEAFARKIGVSYVTLYNWAHEKVDKSNPESDYKNPEFFEAYKEAKQLQKEFLIVNGLNGLYMPSSYIFTAKNITDMKDEQGLKIEKTNDEGKLSDAELDDALAKIQSK